MTVAQARSTRMMGTSRVTMLMTLPSISRRLERPVASDETILIVNKPIMDLLLVGTALFLKDLSITVQLARKYVHMRRKTTALLMRNEYSFVDFLSLYGHFGGVSMLCPAQTLVH